jgi:hypothetical protein
MKNRLMKDKGLTFACVAHFVISMAWYTWAYVNTFGWVMPK